MTETRPLSPEQERRRRARPRRFSFRAIGTRIIEESTGLEAPRPSSMTIGALNPSPDDSDTHHIGQDGRPLFAHTEQYLTQRFVRLLFAYDGRMRAPIPHPNDLREKHDFNRFLAGLGLGMDAGLQRWEQMRLKASRDRRDSRSQLEDRGSEQDEDDAPDDAAEVPEHRRRKTWAGASPPPVDASTRPRRLLRLLSRSAWRRILVSRLAILLERGPDDPCVRKMADYLSRDEDCHACWYDEELRPLYAHAFRDKERWATLLMLEGLSFDRAQRARDQRRAKEPFLMGFTVGSVEYVFALPRRPAQGYSSARLLLLTWPWALSEHVKRNRRIDIRFLAATVWKAGRFLEQPSGLKRRRWTLAQAASYFKLTPRQVEYAALKLRPIVEDLVRSATA